MTKYLVHVSVPVEIDAEDENQALLLARHTVFQEIETYKVDDLSAEIVEELE